MGKLFFLNIYKKTNLLGSKISMDRNELKRIIKEEADKILAEMGIENAEDISPDQIKNLAEECKKINSSLDFRSPIINDEKFIAESTKKTEDNRWKRLVEYRTFADENLNVIFEEESGMRPEDFFDYVVSHHGLNEDSVNEAFLGNVSKMALPFILAGYLSLFGGKVSDAIAQYEKETKTKATAEVVEKGKEIAKAKGVDLEGGDGDDLAKGKPSSKIKYTSTSKPGEIVKYDGNGYPIYEKGTPSHTAWKTSFDTAKSTFETWKNSLADEGKDFKNENPSEVDPHLKFKEIKGNLYLVYHYGEVNPDGSSIENTQTGNNLDYYLDLGPAPAPAITADVEKIPDLTVDTDTISADDEKVTDDQTVKQDLGIKGDKKKFSMNVGVGTHYTKDAAGNRVAHKTGDIINGEKITFPDGISIMMDEKGNYYDITNPQDIKKADPQSAEYGKYDLDGANKIAPSDKRVI